MQPGQYWWCASGSRFVTAKCRVQRCEGPLSSERWEELRNQHLVDGERMYGKHTFACHLVDKACISPVPLLRLHGQVDRLRYLNSVVVSAHVPRSEHVARA